MGKIEFSGEYEDSTEEVFFKAYKRAFTRSVEYIFAKCFENAPVGRTKQGPVNLRNALQYEVFLEDGEAYIGLPRGSELGKIAFYTEMGCFFNPYYTILTRDGRKKFKDLTLNDYVLTHKLQWKKIKKIHQTKVPEVPKQICVKVQGKRSKKKIIVTDDHPFLVERDGKDIWIKAEDLKEGDTVYEVDVCYTSTQERRKEMSEMHKNRTVSEKTKKRMSKSHWMKNPKFLGLKKRVAKKISKRLQGNKRVLGKRWKTKGKARENLRRVALNNIKNMGPEDRKKQGESLRKFYERHPEKHPNRIIKEHERTYGCSKEQYQAYLIIKGYFPEAELEFPVKTKKGMRFIDIAIPDKKLAIEYDGKYWHTDADKDRRRQRLIENEGWNFLRFNSVKEVKEHFKQWKRKT